jgi:uncharacterized protein (UPF0335 family)
VTDDYQSAVVLVVTHQKASTSWLQRQLRVGYNSAARLIEQMEKDGIVSRPDHVGRREVVVLDLVDAAAKMVNGDIAETAPPVAVKESTIMTDSISAEQLRQFIERVERLEEEKKGITDDIKDVYAEAKSTGFDVKTMRTVVRLRKMEKHHRDEADALLETYRDALGLH